MPTDSPAFPQPPTAPTAARHRFGTAEHRDWLLDDARRQFAFFQSAMARSPGYAQLDDAGGPLPTDVQMLHSTTRMIHSYALGHLAGLPDCETVIDRGMAYLWSHHRDPDHGGYLWALDGDSVHDARKLAYGHVFVGLAGSSAKMVGHADADRLIEDVWDILLTRYWDDTYGLFADEWNRDWTPFSNYRGLNANMHGVEALLGLFEATGNQACLDMSGRILDFLVHRMGPAHDWRLPEHYDDTWQVQPDYSEDPMFRPAGTTPGHSLELARLMLQNWDLAGRPDDAAPRAARALTARALADAWVPDHGGLVYTLSFGGAPAIWDRYWWPVTEAIGALGSLLKLGDDPVLADWYAQIWAFAEAHFIDAERGGWYPEIDASGRPTNTQFLGKPELYHAIQATLYPLTPGLSRAPMALSGILAP